MEQTFENCLVGPKPKKRGLKINVLVLLVFIFIFLTIQWNWYCVCVCGMCGRMSIALNCHDCSSLNHLDDPLKQGYLNISPIFPTVSFFWVILLMTLRDKQRHFNDLTPRTNHADIQSSQQSQNRCTVSSAALAISKEIRKIVSNNEKGFFVGTRLSQLRWIRPHVMTLRSVKIESSAILFIRKFSLHRLVTEVMSKSYTVQIGRALMTCIIHLWFELQLQWPPKC